ncbi:hypothetical protein [Borreliella valaisiana]|uniref:hypothetical protein n=1 Tax=Borreliella valaisiana TaxID=62088 RepID=UPI001AEF0514|nr:hypothetical protein [Borreliella valaisiana]
MSKAFDGKNFRFCKKPIKTPSGICFNCKVNIKNKNSDKILTLSLCLIFGCLGICGFFLLTPKAGFIFILISILFFLLNILI